MIEAGRGEREILGHSLHDLDATRGAQRQHPRRRVDADLDAQGRREAPASYTDLNAESRPRQEGPQRKQLRSIGRLMPLEPGLVAAPLGIEGCDPILSDHVIAIPVETGDAGVPPYGLISSVVHEPWIREHQVSGSHRRQGWRRTDKAL